MKTTFESVKAGCGPRPTMMLGFAVCRESGCMTWPDPAAWVAVSAIANITNRPIATPTVLT